MALDSGKPDKVTPEKATAESLVKPQKTEYQHIDDENTFIKQTEQRVRESAVIKEQQEQELKKKEECSLLIQLEKRLYPSRTEKANQLNKFVEQNIILSKIDRLDRNQVNESGKNLQTVKANKQNLLIQINEFKKFHSTEYMNPNKAYVLRKQTQEQFRKEQINKKIANPMYSSDAFLAQKSQQASDLPRVKSKSKTHFKEYKQYIDPIRNPTPDTFTKRSLHQSSTETRPTTTAMSKSRGLQKTKQKEEPYSQQNIKYYQRYVGSDQDFIDSFKPLLERERQSLKSSSTYQQHQDDASDPKPRTSGDEYRRVYSQQGLRRKINQGDFNTPSYGLQKQFNNFPFFFSKSRLKSQTNEDSSSNKYGNKTNK